MSVQPSILALIPARSGSKRIQGKNVKPLCGHPLLAYTIAAAQASGIFGRIIVSTESAETAEIARHYGAEVPFLRPMEFAGDLSPDIEWVRDLLQRLRGAGQLSDCFSLLRPTSPFRQAATIRRAWAQFNADPGVQSLRAVECCKQHPGKMWVIEGGRMTPLLSGGPSDPPWHSMAYQALPPVYVQNASLEIAWSRVPLEAGTIAGTSIQPFLTEGFEGLDLNDARDWWYAEHLVASGQAALPVVTTIPYAAGQTPAVR